MKSKLILFVTLIFVTGLCIGCKDIAGTLKARFSKATQAVSATSSGNFGNTAEETAMIDAITNKYGDLRESGSPRILELMLTSNVVNYIPADRVSQYSKDTDKFYAWFIYDNFNEDTISVEWIYLEDNYSIGTSKSKTGKDFGRGSFTLEAPDEGWPLGRYRVNVSGKGVTQSADFGVVDGDTVSVAILLPDGTVDLAGLSSSGTAIGSEIESSADSGSDGTAASATDSSWNAASTSTSSSSAGTSSGSSTSSGWQSGSSTSGSSAAIGSASYFAGSLGGTWAVNFNNYTGKMEFYPDNGKWAGRLYLDAHGRWETLKNISCNSQTGAVSFYREAGNQTYTGIISDRDMAGTFTGGYKWSASLSSFTTTATAASTSTQASTSTTTTSSSSTSSSAGQQVWHRKSYVYVPYAKDGQPRSSYLAGTTSVLIDYTQASGGRLTGFKVKNWRTDANGNIVGAGTANECSSTTQTVIGDPPEYIKPGDKPSMSVSHKLITTSDWGAGNLVVSLDSTHFKAPDGTYMLTAQKNFNGTVTLPNAVAKGTKGATRQLTCSMGYYKFIFTYEWLE